MLALFVGSPAAFRPDHVRYQKATYRSIFITDFVRRCGFATWPFTTPPPITNADDLTGPNRPERDKALDQRWKKQA